MIISIFTFNLLFYKDAQQNKKKGGHNESQTELNKTKNTLKGKTSQTATALESLLRMWTPAYSYPAFWAHNVTLKCTLVCSRGVLETVSVSFDILDYQGLSLCPTAPSNCCRCFHGSLPSATEIATNCSELWTFQAGKALKWCPLKTSRWPGWVLRALLSDFLVLFFFSSEVVQGSGLTKRCRIYEQYPKEVGS